MNKIFLIGNIGFLDFQTSKAGKPYCKFRLGVNRRKKSEGGAAEADWFNCCAFGKVAELMETYLDVGSKILVEGSVETSQYEKGGERRYSTDVLVDRIEFLGGKTKGERPQTAEKENDNETIPF